MIIARPDEPQRVNILTPQQLSEIVVLPHPDGSQLSPIVAGGVAIVGRAEVVAAAVPEHCDDLQELALGEGEEEKEQWEIGGFHLY